MKIKQLIIAFLILPFFTSCEKEEVKENQLEQNKEIEVTNENPKPPKDEPIPAIVSEAITIKDGVVDFETVQAYENIIDADNNSGIYIEPTINYINQLGFNSLEKIGGFEEEIDDKLGRTMLNKDRIMSIGEWFILIEMNKDRVSVIHEGNEDAYNKLLAGNDAEIKFFKPEDDVIDYLVNPNEYEVQALFGCSETSAPTDNDTHAWDEYCDNYKFKFKQAYYSIGVYKKLRLEFWHKQISGSSNTTNFSFGYRYQWKKKCRDESADVFHTASLWEHTDDNHTLPFYSGTRALSKYYIGGFWSGGATVFFKNKCTNGVYTQTIFETLKHGY